MKDLVAGGAFILVGIAVMIYSATVLSLGTVQLPGPGFFPFVCGGFFIVFSAIWLSSVRKSGGDEDDEPFFAKGMWIKPLLAVLLILAYAFVMEPLGYILSTLFFMMLWQLVLERTKVPKTLIISVITAVVLYYLFTMLLQVPLPSGIFIL